jgi:hypothetical protein
MGLWNVGDPAEDGETLIWTVGEAGLIIVSFSTRRTGGDAMK